MEVGPDKAFRGKHRDGSKGTEMCIRDVELSNG
jgi:hypothetical protein